MNNFSNTIFLIYLKNKLALLISKHAKILKMRLISRKKSQFVLSKKVFAKARKFNKSKVNDHIIIIFNPKLLQIFSKLI